MSIRFAFLSVLLLVALDPLWAQAQDQDEHGDRESTPTQELPHDLTLTNAVAGGSVTASSVVADKDLLLRAAIRSDDASGVLANGGEISDVQAALVRAALSRGDRDAVQRIDEWFTNEVMRVPTATGDVLIARRPDGSQLLLVNSSPQPPQP